MSTNSLEAIRERQAKRKVQIFPDAVRPRFTSAYADVDYLLSALEAAQQENERLREWQAGLQATTLSWAENAINLRNELLETVNAEIARQAEFGMYPGAEDFRIAVEAMKGK